MHKYIKLHYTHTQTHTHTHGKTWELSGAISHPHHIKCEYQSSFTCSQFMSSIILRSSASHVFYRRVTALRRHFSVSPYGVYLGFDMLLKCTLVYET